MPPYSKEHLRLQALQDHDILDTPPDPYYDSLTHLANSLTEAPICLVSLVDSERQFFKSSFGLPEDLRETPRTHSFCSHVVDHRETMIVNDSLSDDRVKDNPAIEDLGVASYLGAPIVDSEGHVLGAFCAIDTKPREWSERDIQSVENLASLVTKELDRNSATKIAIAATESLKQQNAHLKDCIAMLAHDLKNPLNGIIFNAAMMSEHVPQESPALIEIVETISSAAERMDTHIDRLLDKGKNGLCALTGSSKLIDLEESIHDALENQQMQIKEKNLSIKLDSPKTESVALADPVALDQVLDNLLSNAIKFSPSGGEILIQYSPCGFIVSDQGPGFSDVDLPQIFTPFVRLSNSDQKGVRSTGLGLYLCRQLVEAMDGEITYLSDADAPASFLVRFPTL